MTHPEVYIDGVRYIPAEEVLDEPEPDFPKRASMAAINLIKKWEGFRSNAYLDSAGVWTIGYGHTLNVLADDTVSKEEAEQLLREDVAWAEECVSKALNGIVTIPQESFDALVSFHYNTGAIARVTLTKKHNARDYAGAAREFARWNKAVAATLTV